MCHKRSFVLFVWMFFFCFVNRRPKSRLKLNLSCRSDMTRHRNRHKHTHGRTDEDWGDVQWGINEMRMFGIYGFLVLAIYQRWREWETDPFSLILISMKCGKKRIIERKNDNFGVTAWMVRSINLMRVGFTKYRTNVLYINTCVSVFCRSSSTPTV